MHEIKYPSELSANQTTKFLMETPDGNC